MNCKSAQDFKKQSQQNGKWNNIGESSATNFRSMYLYKLAPESPCNRSYEIHNHDESSYDSFHNWETDVCKDSTDDDFSDSDSSKTEGYAVLDVEYEVASTTDDDDDSVTSASSGTDEFAYEAATAAYYEFNALINRNQDMSDEDSDEFILADTEDDTEGSCDLELGQADYWKCVKCNNKQNNPLYRYCEKCYQVRKSLFPPRPKRLKKARTSNNRKRKMAQQNHDYSTTEIDSESEFDSPAKKKFVRDECVSPTPSIASSSNSIRMKNGNQYMKKENSKHANSAGELSCNNTSSDDCGDDVETSTTSSFNPKKDIRTGEIVKKIKVSPSASIEIAKVGSCTNLIKLESSPNDKNYLDFKVENKIIQNVYRQEMCGRRASPPKYLDSKDSGVSSCQESSQEFSISPLEESGNYLVRSTSSISSQSVESNSDFPISQASTQIQHDSDDNETDSEGILTRVEEFTNERQGKLKQQQDSSSKPVTSPDLFSSSEDINDSNLGMCRFCMVNPKNGVFLHKNFVHVCCCYKCAVKVWKKRKTCPICNCKIKNVTKLFVH